MREFWLCFVPLFVAVDAFGVLPIYMNLTEGLERRVVRRILVQSTVTASVTALVFLAIGRFVLRFMNVTVADFLVAGGAVLFAISLGDLLNIERHRRPADLDSMGAVPLGVPLIVGPAVLTTMLVLEADYEAALTILATLVNIALAGAVFWSAASVNRVLGKAGSKTVSKLAALLLAAIAVRMVRRGVLLIVAAAAQGAT